MCTLGPMRCYRPSVPQNSFCPLTPKNTRAQVPGAGTGGTAQGRGSQGTKALLQVYKGLVDATFASWEADAREAQHFEKKLQQEVDGLELEQGTLEGMLRQLECELGALEAAAAQEEDRPPQQEYTRALQRQSDVRQNDKTTAKKPRVQRRGAKGRNQDHDIAANVLTGLEEEVRIWQLRLQLAGNNHRLAELSEWQVLLGQQGQLDGTMPTVENSTLPDANADTVSRTRDAISPAGKPVAKPSSSRVSHGQRQGSKSNIKRKSKLASLPLTLNCPTRKRQEELLGRRLRR
eukprot:evm.model.scf_97.5 EVM.evm.TU.scf_97.5   scf_97:94409-96249(-)